MAKNFMKITKLAFLGQNSGGQADFLVNGRDPLRPPPHSENSAQTLNFVKPQSTADFKVDCVKIILRKSC